MNNRFELEKGIRLEPVVSTSIDTKGELEVLNTGGYLNYHNGTSASHVVTANHTETLTNKTITSPVITTPTGITKADVGLSNVDNTSDATKNAAAVALTNHTIDGDTNTVQDLALASLKTIIGDANKILKRDAAGIVVSSAATLDASDNLKVPGTIYIGSGTIDTSAAFQVDSTIKGSLFSRVTTAQRNAIATPANGLWVFNTDTRIFEYYDSVSTSWAAVGAGAGGVVLTAQQSIGTGNGILTSFGPLDNVPNSEEAVLVTIDGLVEDEANWSLSGSNIVFSVAPAVAQNIYVYYMYGAGPGGGGEANTASNMGTGGDGEGFVTTKVGVDLPFKRLKAGTNVTLTSETNDIKIDVAIPAITFPTVTRKTSGSGTYTTPANVRYLRITMVGAGGGGSGSSSNAFDAGDGNNGTNSTFGTSLLTAGLGTGGAHPISSGANGGTGGTNTISSPAISVINVNGGTGGSNLYRTGGNTNGSGGAGGNSALGGGGNGAIGNGGNGQTNTGSGGAGGGQTASSGDFSTGAGGGAGGYLEAIITSPSATYSYVVGVSGGGGSAGSAGSSGGIGGSGLIVIEEYY